MEDLKTLLLNYEKIVAEPLHPHLSASPSSIARAIREICATRAACDLLSALRLAFPETDDTCWPPVPSSELRPVLPSLKDIEAAAPMLIEAVVSSNQSAAVRALERMRVLALCPSCAQDFSRLEHSVGSIVGRRVRLIPLIELANLAAELCYFENASKYVNEAHSLSPGPAQLHHLHTISGLVALNEGNLPLAIECLAASARVCRKDDWACLDCSVRGHNLTLADKLLDHEQYESVALYLVACLDVWKFNKSRIQVWIDEIRTGRRPDFSAPSILSRSPEHMMRRLIMFAALMPEVPPEDRGVGTVEEFRKQTAERTRRAIRGKLDSGI
jgi:hypothetical protein